MAPFTSFLATQTRLVRLTAYLLQFNIVILALMMVYGPEYRQGDNLRQDTFLDSKDIENIQTASLIGSFALLPLIHPLVSLAENRVNIGESRLEATKQSMIAKACFISLYVLSNIGTIVIAAWICKMTPTANQHALASAIFASFVFATMFTNMVRALAYATCQMRCITPACVRLLINDIESINNHRRGGSKQGKELA